MTQETLNQPGSDSGVTTPPPTPPAGGQSNTENFEERFKGQQRLTNQLQTQLDGARAALAAAQAEANNHKQSATQTASQAEAERTALAAQIADLTKLKTTLEGQVGEYKQKLELQESREATRKALVAADASDVLEAFDMGYLNVTGLEGEALTSAIEGFRGMIGKLAERQYQGATPPQAPSNQQKGSSPEGQSADQLFEWLNDQRNFNDPSWETFQEAYHKLTAGK